MRQRFALLARRSHFRRGGVKAGTEIYVIKQEAYHTVCPKRENSLTFNSHKVAWSNRRFYDGDCKESFVTLKTFYLAIPCYSEIPPIWGHVLIPRGPSYLGPPHTVRSLFSVPKRQNPVFQGSLQMPECFWNAGSFVRISNNRIVGSQFK